ncbi:MAG: site-2 protease family protein [Lewinellaceae bacterium]|nr:site-2 protease family protein [Lewinellaceae bacterium]
MRSSLKIFTWFGIPVHLHWSFGFIFLLALWIGFTNNFTPLGTAWLVGYFIAVFGCVLLHEYGHALMARHYGVRTQDIILTPIGGIARLERMPEKPVQEFFVAIAGPLVNVVIAILLFGLAALIFQGERWMLFNWFLEQYLSFGGEEDMSGVMDGDGLPTAWFLYFFTLLLVTNIILVLFNLIPAFPMDGGRILRSLLSIQMGRVRATQMAALLGQGIAVLFVFVGVTGLWGFGFTLALIGFFVFITARTENAMVRLDALLRGYKARDLMRPQFARLSANDWMQTPVTMLQQGLERHFLVFDLEDHLVGILEEPQILAALKKRDLTAEIAQYMSPNVKIVHLEQGLEHIYHLVQSGSGILAVAEEGEIVGVIDQAGLQNFLRINAR